MIPFYRHFYFWREVINFFVWHKWGLKKEKQKNKRLLPNSLYVNIVKMKCGLFRINGLIWFMNDILPCSNESKILLFEIHALNVWSKLFYFFRLQSEPQWKLFGWHVKNFREDLIFLRLHLQKSKYSSAVKKPWNQSRSKLAQ